MGHLRALQEQEIPSCILILEQKLGKSHDSTPMCASLFFLPLFPCFWLIVMSVFPFPLFSTDNKLGNASILPPFLSTAPSSFFILFFLSAGNISSQFHNRKAGKQSRRQKWGRQRRQFGRMDIIITVSSIHNHRLRFFRFKFQ